MLSSPSRPIRTKPVYLLLLRVGIHIVSLYLLINAFFAALNGTIPGDPVQYILDFTGIGALNLLIASLVISPLAQHTKFAQLVALRKTLGVYAGVYASSHFSSFIAFELQFEWGLVLSEIIERPYISVGFISFIILVALLFSSFDYIKKQMTSRWQKLHNWVYLAVALGTLHYAWALKTLTLEPLIYISLCIWVLFMRRKKLLKFIK